MIPVLVKQFYLSELTIIMIGTGAKAIALALKGFSTETWMLYLDCPLQLIAGPCFSCLLAMATKLSDLRDSTKIICLSMISWIILKCAGTLLITTVALKMYAIFQGSTFILLTISVLLIFGCTLWLSANLKVHQHQTLLENVRLIESSSSVLDVDSEQWLLDACTNDSYSNGDDDIPEECPNVINSKETCTSSQTPSPVA